MKKMLISSYLLSSVLLSQAQTTERIQINGGNFVVPQQGLLKGFFRPALSQAGFSYLHQITPRIGIKLAYSEWISVWEYNAPKSTVSGRFAAAHQDEASNYYSGCTSVDIIASYKIVTHKHHEVYVGSGPSYIRLERTEYSGYFPLSYNHRKIGIVAEAGYNYTFCRQRLNIGLSETMKAHKDVPLLLYTNLNIGYNFNWKVKKNTTAKLR